MSAPPARRRARSACSPKRGSSMRPERDLRVVERGQASGVHPGGPTFQGRSPAPRRPRRGRRSWPTGRGPARKARQSVARSETASVRARAPAKSRAKTDASPAPAGRRGPLAPPRDLAGGEAEVGKLHEDEAAQDSESPTPSRARRPRPRRRAPRRRRSACRHRRSSTASISATKRGVVIVKSATS